MSTEEKQIDNSSAVKAAKSDSDKPKQRRRRRSSNSRSNKRRDDKKVTWSPSQYVVPEVEGKVRFMDFNLPDDVLHAVADLGFEYATAIQAETIPSALEGKDIIGKAQTGTGKTAAFLLGIITDLIDYPIEERRRLAEPRALIVAPTRELAMQIAADAEGLAKYTDLHVVSLVGGMDYDKQRQLLKKKPVDILVATPGRLLDFVNNKEVDLWNVEVLVLDEADRMLSMGFIPDVRSIIRATPRKGQDRQTLLYSATFTDDIMNLAQQWTLDAVQIEIEPEQKTSENVAQKVFLVSAKEKYKLLRNYIRINNIEKVIVFGNRRHETRSLCERLQKDGVSAALMSGEITQQKRIRTLEDFRSGKIEVLVATDVAGRGIHIDGVTHVINYQLPDDPDDYVHRIGRTGRAGATGTSICFACENDSFMIPEVEAEAGIKLECIHPGPELLADLDKPAKKGKKQKDEEAEEAPAASEPSAPVEVAAEENAEVAEAEVVTPEASEPASDSKDVPAAESTEVTEVVVAEAPVPSEEAGQGEAETKAQEESEPVETAKTAEENLDLFADAGAEKSEDAPAEDVAESAPANEEVAEESSEESATKADDSESKTGEERSGG